MTNVFIVYLKFIKYSQAEKLLLLHVSDNQLMPTLYITMLAN